MIVLEIINILLSSNSFSFTCLNSINLFIYMHFKRRLKFSYLFLI